MTIKELITKLQEYPEDARFEIDTFDESFTEIRPKNFVFTPSGPSQITKVYALDLIEPRPAILTLDFTVM